MITGDDALLGLQPVPAHRGPAGAAALGGTGPASAVDVHDPAVAAMMRCAGDNPQHVHIAAFFSHKGSSGLRYSLNPPGTQAGIRQHLDIGQGEGD